ncbi:MAG: c-type cytochrome [Cyanobacteria bacterium J06626_18]
MKVLVVCLLIVCLGSVINPGLARADASETASPPLPTAARLFESNCAGCHPGGGNVIRRGKNLKQRALQRNGYTDVSEIATLIAQGKGLMRPYQERLSEDEIQTLAQYVLSQAEVNWQ